MNDVHSNYPSRDTLPHGTPSWVEPGSLFFITLCCSPRGENQLCHLATASVIFESVDFRQRRLDWHVTLLVLMPDHLHLLAAFPRDSNMEKVVTDWKSLLARKLGIKWQRDFFDHRLRSDESWQEKAEYMRQNPVRAGLVQSVFDWKFIWNANNGGPGRAALP